MIKLFKLFESVKQYEITSKEHFDLYTKQLIVPNDFYKGSYVLKFTVDEKKQIDDIINSRDALEDYHYDQPDKNVGLSYSLVIYPYVNCWWVKKYKDYILVNWDKGLHRTSLYWSFPNFESFLEVLRKYEPIARRVYPFDHPELIFNPDDPFGEEI
jgi:hypothetical protein